MTGFDHKVLHLSQAGASAAAITIEVDFLGHGVWEKYETVSVPGGGYRYHVFPSGFSAHWVRRVCGRACRATAEFVRT
jgi:hypothetical protein